MPVPQSVVTQVREKMGNPTEETLSSDVIKRELDTSLTRQNPNYVWTSGDITDSTTQSVIPDNEIYLVVWLTIASLAYELAARYAESIHFVVENDNLEVDLSKIIGNYMQMAGTYSNLYDNDPNSSAGKLQVFTAKRRSWETGKMAQWYKDETQ